MGKIPREIYYDDGDILKAISPLPGVYYVVEEDGELTPCLFLTYVTYLRRSKLSPMERGGIMSPYQFKRRFSVDSVVYREFDDVLFGRSNYPEFDY